MERHYWLAGLALAALFASEGCATTYAYHFDLTDPRAHEGGRPGSRDTVDDPDVSVAIELEPLGAAAVLLEVTNKTDQVLQVDWAQIAMRHPNGATSSLRPDGDLGWILPGTKQAAWLSPFVLPTQGVAAAAYNGQQLELVVPMTVRRETRVYRYPIVVRAQPREGA